MVTKTKENKAATTTTTKLHGMLRTKKKLFKNSFKIVFLHPAKQLAKNC